MKIRGILRLTAAVIVSIILLPFVIRLYTAVSPGATAEEIMQGFIQAAPFGDRIETVTLAVWEEAQSGADSVVNWLMDQEQSFAVHFTTDTAEMIFTSVVVLLFYHMTGDRLFKDTSGEFFNRTANAVIQVFLTFCASLVVSWVFNLFGRCMQNVLGIVHDIVSFVYSGGLTICCFIILMVAGIRFMNALLMVGMECLKTLFSYGMFLWILINEINSGSWFGTVGGICVWLIGIGLLQVPEEILIGKK